MSRAIEISAKQFLDRIPSKWEDVTLDDYINKILPIVMCSLENINEHSDEVNNYQLSSMSTVITYDNFIQIAANYHPELSIGLIEQFDLRIINMMVHKLSFLSKVPMFSIDEIDESKYKFPRFTDDVKFNSLIVWEKVQTQMAEGDFKYLPLLVQSLSKETITLEQAGKMNMVEFETCFFLLRRYLMKYFQTTSTSLMKRLVWLKVKEKFSILKKT